MDFASGLRNAGLKATNQRLEILKTIDKMGHSLIEEIYADVVKTIPYISLATVYKNLEDMKNKSIVNNININGNKPYWEINKDVHSHFFCERCGLISDIYLPLEVNLDVSNSIKNKKELINRINSFTITFFGICKECSV